MKILLVEDEPAVAAFLHQAGLVLAHPTEPDAVRLVAFHEALPDARTSRPTVYG